MSGGWPTTPPDDVDRSLWFEPGCCGAGDHFLHYNPHTFPGRMGAYCEAHDRTFAVSRSEIERCSSEAAIWIRGFLSGNEPPVPLEPTGYSIDDDRDPRYKRWREAISEFRRTGAWPRGAPTGVPWPEVDNPAFDRD